MNGTFNASDSKNKTWTVIVTDGQPVAGPSFGGKSTPVYPRPTMATSGGLKVLGFRDGNRRLPDGEFIVEDPAGPFRIYTNDPFALDWDKSPTRKS